MVLNPVSSLQQCNTCPVTGCKSHEFSCPPKKVVWPFNALYATNIHNKNITRKKNGALACLPPTVHQRLQDKLPPV